MTLCGKVGGKGGKVGGKVGKVGGKVGGMVGMVGGKVGGKVGSHQMGSRNTFEVTLRSLIKKKE